VYLYFILQQYISTGQREFITVSTPTHDGCFHHSPPPSFLIQIHLNLLLLSSTLFNSDQNFFSLFSFCIWLLAFRSIRNWLDLNPRWGVLPRTPLSHVTDYQLHSGWLYSVIDAKWIQILTLICILFCWFRFYLSWNSFIFLNPVNLCYLISCLLLRICWVWLIVFRLWIVLCNPKYCTIEKLNYIGHSVVWDTGTIGWSLWSIVCIFVLYLFTLELDLLF
jgi:hypothetical protein